MTKAERRKARKAARREGRALEGELVLPNEIDDWQETGRRLQTAFHRINQQMVERAIDEHDDRGFDSPGGDAFTETPRGRKALDRWARAYDELNGAPEGEWDR